MSVSEFRCCRCAKSELPLTAPPVPGDLGREIAAMVCSACWQEWQQAEVMVINELRLNFMEPKSLEILERQMRDFLVLDGSTPQTE